MYVYTCVRICLGMYVCNICLSLAHLALRKALNMLRVDELFVLVIRFADVLRK